MLVGDKFKTNFSQGAQAGLARYPAGKYDGRFKICLAVAWDLGMIGSANHPTAK